jgi:hypothetical protein
MVMDVYTGEMYNENFWIHYSNSWGTQIYSKKINVEVIYNCNFDQIIHNPDRPVGAELEAWPELYEWQ